jgi:hypothetical protein
MTRTVLMLVVPMLASSCSRDDTRPASGGVVVAAPPSAPARVSLGNVMVQVARRFEIAGKAAVGRRYELAAFEAGELEELFESDVLDAEPPKEGPTAQIPAMAKAFLATNAPELKRAAASGDTKAFTLAFERAAAACNACHSASAKGFIQIPAIPGASVPEVEAPPPSAPLR